MTKKEKMEKEARWGKGNGKVVSEVSVNPSGYWSLNFSEQVIRPGGKSGFVRANIFVRGKTCGITVYNGNGYKDATIKAPYSLSQLAEYLSLVELHLNNIDKALGRKGHKLSGEILFPSSPAPRGAFRFEREDEHVCFLHRAMNDTCLICGKPVVDPAPVREVVPD